MRIPKNILVYPMSAGYTLTESLLPAPDTHRAPPASHGAWRATRPLWALASLGQPFSSHGIQPFPSSYWTICQLQGQDVEWIGIPVPVYGGRAPRHHTQPGLRLSKGFRLSKVPL